MTKTRVRPLHERGRFAGADPDAIRAAVEREGWEPLLIHDRPGTVYPEHEHLETKLLVFLSGSMIVKTGGERYDCHPGDRLVIPGAMRHAAWVGKDGCTFFWSEQVRGSV
jgi:mannose-6-phosphate isomerase-like protein (cupin superfamily)